jgi:hypothetical protein
MNSLNKQSEDTKQSFLKSLSAWASKPYAADLRYIACRGDECGHDLLSAELVLAPLPIDDASTFQVTAGNLIAGQVVLNNLDPSDLEELVTTALNGRIVIGNQTLTIDGDEPLTATASRSGQEWSVKPNILLTGKPTRISPDDPHVRLADQELRQGDIPFDGMDELVRWLAVSDPRARDAVRALQISLRSPCEVAFDRSGFSGDTFTIAINAQPTLNTDNLGVAVITFPGTVNESRKQLGPKMTWRLDRKSTLLQGEASIDSPKAERALVILNLGQTFVQRQWFGHPAKSPNERLLAAQCFDQELKQIRHCLFDGSQPEKFELAVAALAFLRGYSPAVQLETDSPDILLTTPGGQLVLVECTLQTRDVHSKVGKLVDRRHAITDALAAAKLSRPVLAILVTRQQRDQIAMSDDEFRSRRVCLVTRHELEEHFRAVGFPHDPDHEVSSAFDRLPERVTDQATPD